MKTGSRWQIASFIVAFAAAVLGARVEAQSCPGDLVPDGRVDGLDLGVLLAYWGPTSAVELSQAADLNQDSVVDGNDLGTLLARWGFCRPVVTSVTPAAGCYLGGTDITITGAWLAQVSSVTVGGNPCTGVTPLSSTTIRATVPAGVPGTAAIVVTTPGGLVTSPSSFLYQPSGITSIMPTAGLLAGGTSVTISGACLGGTSSVTFGGVPAASFTVVSDSRVIAITPPGTLGPVDVQVSTPNGAVVIAGGFSYLTVRVPTWATFVEDVPDPMVVTDLDLRQAIIATGWAWRVRDQATQVEMLLVPPGTFQMGCSRSMQHPCFNGELPVHEVTLTNPFYVGRYEITQAQWQAVAGSNPSFFRSPSSAVPASQVPWRPVESVSFTAVQSFLETTGMRLLTEAEWEYACRAGTQAAFSNGSDDDSTVPPIAWFQSGSLDQTRPVGLKAANGLGLHDMQGNVWEWVSDRWGNYSESAQTNPTGPASGPPLVRGGGYLDIVREMRSSTRAWYTNGSSGSHSSIGFRVARNP